MRGFLLGEQDHSEMLLRGLRTAQEGRAGAKGSAEAEAKTEGGGIAFVLNCIPTPQARPRHAVMHGYSRTYKSATQVSNERTLDALLAVHAPDTPLQGAVSLEFVAVFPVPQSASGKKRREMLDGRLHHTHKPDLDNLCKQLKDAMTRLQFWHDDRQVTRVVCEKRYGEQGQWVVCVREM